MDTSSRDTSIPGGGNNKSATALHNFTRLPNELKDMVWREGLAARQPNVVRLCAKKKFYCATDQHPATLQERLHFVYKIPPLLHVCQSSRRLAKEIYELTFDQARIPVGYEGYPKKCTKCRKKSMNCPFFRRPELTAHIPKVYFDFGTDIVYIACQLEAASDFLDNLNVCTTRRSLLLKHRALMSTELGMELSKLLFNFP